MVKVNGFLAARLLFPEEWENIVATVPNVPVDIGGYWWLSNPDKKNTPERVFCVNKNGEVVFTYLDDASLGVSFAYLRDVCLGVRPVFVISGKAGNVGDKVYIKNLPCTVFELTNTPIGGYHTRVLSDVVLKRETLSSVEFLLHSSILNDILEEYNEAV